MADQTQSISSTFPNPPDFLWRNFTPDRIARFEEAKKAWLQETPDGAAPETLTIIPNLPEDLGHLQPPPEPADGTWRSLGGVWTLKDELPTLQESGIQSLEPVQNGNTPGDTNRERALNLKRLTKSALLNFLEFAGVASIDPDGLNEKADDIENILINIHHGINEYRPHQARESLIQTMQARLDQIRNETAAVNAVTDKAKRVLEGLGSIDAPAPRPATVEEQGVHMPVLQNGTPDSEAGDDDSAEVWAQAAGFA